jgi:hypothetical protein
MYIPSLQECREARIYREVTRRAWLFSGVQGVDMCEEICWKFP